MKAKCIYPGDLIGNGSILGICVGAGLRSVKLATMCRLYTFLMFDGTVMQIVLDDEQSQRLSREYKSMLC